jgi:hypothetical protein
MRGDALQSPPTQMHRRSTASSRYRHLTFLWGEARDPSANQIPTHARAGADNCPLSSWCDGHGHHSTTTYRDRQRRPRRHRPRNQPQGGGRFTGEADVPAAGHGRSDGARNSRRRPSHNATSCCHRADGCRLDERRRQPFGRPDAGASGSEIRHQRLQERCFHGVSSHPPLFLAFAASRCLGASPWRGPARYPNG